MPNINRQVIEEKLASLIAGSENARAVVAQLRQELSNMEKNIIATDGAISVLQELLQAEQPKE